MGIRDYKPTSPARRWLTGSDFDTITKSKPEKALTEPKKRISGRNNNGRITMRRRGGGHKKLYRIIDFKRNKHDIPAKVAAVEYDPNRSARIALLFYADGEKRYILCPKGLQVGDQVISGAKAPVRVGNSLKLKDLPAGTTVHNIELKEGKGGQMARSAGSYAQLVAFENRYAYLKLPSGEVRKVFGECYATVGEVGNSEHNNISWGKAGRSRWRGLRPKVRGVVMNPVDHPHGGGEGRTSGGRHPVTPWGVSTKGHKTRNNKRTDKYIITDRRKKRQA